jgi:uroporphyrinogen-III synthase
VITSANAARALAQHPARARLVSKSAYTVGAQSRSAAMAAGFSSIVQGGGDVGTVIAQVQRDLDPAKGPLLYLSGEETSGDLEAVLRNSGFEIDRVIMYAAVPATHLSPSVTATLKRHGANGVLLYSRRTAKVWTRCVVAAELEPYMKDIIHFCLSAAVASVIPSGWHIKVAANPSEQAMLDLIEEAARDQAERPSHGG